MPPARGCVCVLFALAAAATPPPLYQDLATMSPMASALCLSLLAAPGLAFVRTPFVGNQVNHAPAQASRSRTSTRMVATPDKVSTGVKRNENFAKLKVGD